MQRWPSLHHGVPGGLEVAQAALEPHLLVGRQVGLPPLHCSAEWTCKAPAGCFVFDILLSMYVYIYIYIFNIYIYIYIYIYCNVLFLVLPQPLYINQESMYQEIQYTGANIIRVANRIGFRIAFYDKFRPQSLSSHCCGTFILHILILLQMQLQIIITI